LERNRVIDPLPDRQADSLTDWLRGNPLDHVGPAQGDPMKHNAHTCRLDVRP